MLLCNSYLDFCFSSRPNKCKIGQGKIFKPQISLVTSGQQLSAVSVNLRFMETNVSGFLLTQASIRVLGKKSLHFPQGQPNTEGAFSLTAVLNLFSSL